MRGFFNKTTDSHAIINRINCDKLNISCLTEIITDALRDRKMRAFSKNRQQKNYIKSAIH
ncbi:UNVERIFIED_CONTAM: hypothetical protein DQE83_26050 [Escherichia coli]